MENKLKPAEYYRTQLEKDDKPFVAFCNRIDAAIKESVKAGNDGLDIDLKSAPAALAERIIKHLEANGFEVEQRHDHDITIKW